jgi:hypothetical protein
VAVSLVLALLACVPESETQKQVRDLEGRLRPFPPAEVITANLEISERHLKWLREAHSAIPSHQQIAYAAHVVEAEQLHEAWSELYSARRCLKGTRFFEDGSKKKAEPELDVANAFVEALEKRLGEVNFRAGRMPPPVPVWRFQWVD